MRLPNAAHAAQPWRIHGLAGDFRVEDVWALPTPGGPDDLGRLVQQLSSGDGAVADAQGRFVGDGSRDLVSRAGRALFALRWKLGDALGWDRPGLGVGARVRTLRDRLPDDLRDAPPGPDLRPVVPFTSVYLVHDEWAAEMANRTVHAVMHIGWVPDGTGGHRGQMAVLVKPNGRLGHAYMAAIRPFRRLVVDPAFVRMVGRRWQAGAEAGDPTGSHQEKRRTQMIRWAGRLIVLYGAAHTLGALTVEGAARHAGAWFSGELWGDDLAEMSPANSALWLSVDSFGVPLIVLGLTVLWLDHHGITPPPFIAWTLGIWTVVDAVILLLTPWPILLLADVLLLLGIRRARHRDDPVLAPPEYVGT